MKAGRQISVIVTFLLFGQHYFGQTKSIFVPIHRNSSSYRADTSFWYIIQNNNFLKAELPDLKKSIDSLHFRFSTDIQAVDIWTTNFQTFHGIFTNFTTSYHHDPYKLDPRPEAFFSSKSNLDEKTAKEIYNIFNSLSIFSIPTDSRILGWESGNDGIEYLIEYSTPTNYSFKEYWTPYAYKKTIKEAALIDSLVQQLETNLQLAKKFKDFINTLPEGSYYAGDHGGLNIITTDKKAKKKKNK
ncbi:MAG: hypothetical protein JNK50_15025 [Bacteroidia bacterium]|nr:hypothetical protein [Bacteroidia bacterium]